MTHQAPMISIPKKGTDEVDWTSPIRSVIAQSYGESPDTYAAECAALQRCRQDAVKGAGSDLTGPSRNPTYNPSFESDWDLSASSRSPLQIFRPAGTRGTSIPRDQGQFPLERCLHEQTNHPDLHRLRKGFRHLPHRSYPFFYRC